MMTSHRPRLGQNAAPSSASTTGGVVRGSGPGTRSSSEQSGSDSEKRPRADVGPGDTVRVTTLEGAWVRGKRRWRLLDLGIVHSRHHKFDHAWVVLVNGHVVILFSDELELARETG